VVLSTAYRVGHEVRLPQERSVEVLHIPKTGGSTIIEMLALANASFCFTETGCPAGLVIAGRHFRCGCSTELIGVHERPFGWQTGGTAGSSSTLYVSLVREPKSWLKSAISQQCNGPFKRSDTCVKGNFSEWFMPGAARKFYFSVDNLQLNMLGSIWNASNFLVCTIEGQAHVRRSLEYVLHRQLPTNVVANRANAKQWQTPADFDFLEYESHYRADEQLYRIVSSAQDACVSRFTHPLWQGLAKTV